MRRRSALFGQRRGGTVVRLPRWLAGAREGDAEARARVCALCRVVEVELYR